MTSRRSVRPHTYVPDQDAPGTCALCHLIRRHVAHGQDAPEEPPDARERAAGDK